MKRITLLLLALSGCHRHEDHSHDEWLPHVPTAWVTTSNGHVRDAGPFASVQAGWTTDAEIDAAVDDAYVRFASAFGQAAPEVPCAINDDYCLWVPDLEMWASGVEYEGYRHPHITVCLWLRWETQFDPGPAWIVRPPGEYWGVNYDLWRHTTAPLVPALMHELLHAWIGDPDHTSPLWAKVT